MTHAYDPLYLDGARRVFGRMLDFAVHDLHYDLNEFFALFLQTDLADLFERGDYSVNAGRSGIELAYEVLDRSGLAIERKTPLYRMDRSVEYWTGWALAYYQWRTALRFSEILRRVPLDDIQALYSPYHEMDIRHFADRMDALSAQAKPETNLKTLRKQAGFSQKELAERAGVPLRTIQQYEQRQKDINKAQVDYLIRFADALGCNVETLVERGQ